MFILDLDGTLIDSRHDLATAVNLVRARYGLKPLSVDAVAGYVGDGVRKLMERALAGADIDLEEAVRLQRTFYGQHLCDETTLYPGVDEGLRELHALGHSLALATNKPVDATEQILRHFSIRSLFGVVLGGGSTEHLKPHPEVVRHAMQTLGARPEDTWMVGDNVTDLECARLAGVRSVFFTYGIGRTQGEIPTLTFDTFGDFVAAFRSSPSTTPP